MPAQAFRISEGEVFPGHVPEMQNFHAPRLQDNAVIDIQRRMLKPPGSWTTVYRCAEIWKIL